jgi:hypothetical protein
MLPLKKRWLIAAAVGLYLYFLLPATATLFYELYHLTEIGPIYWGYSAFKAAGYYFGTWKYQLLSCLLVAAAIVALPYIIDKMRRT